MQAFPINYIAVVVAAVVAHFLGALWYSPALFGKKWMELNGFTKQRIEDMKKKGMAKSYFVSFIASLVTSYVLANAIVHSGAAKMSCGLFLSFWCWLGFVAPVMLGGVLWEGKPFTLFGINVTHYLVSLLVMGAILVSWPAKAQPQTQTIAFAVPILPGKTDAWKQFAQEMGGPRVKEFAQSRARIGVVVERSYLELNPKGDMAVVFIEGNNLKNFFHILGASQDPFDVWFRAQVLNIHGVDLSKELPPTPEEFLDWHAK